MTFVEQLRHFSLDPVGRGEGWQRHFDQEPWEREAVLVADSGTGVVGFASIGPSRDDDAKDEGEVRANYLLEQWWGHGLGRELMVAPIDALARFGYPQATLWVLDTTDRARASYEAGDDPRRRHQDQRPPRLPIAEVRYRRCRCRWLS